jgi:hypothetical protein
MANAGVDPPSQAVALNAKTTSLLCLRDRQPAARPMTWPLRTTWGSVGRSVAADVPQFWKSSSWEEIRGLGLASARSRERQARGACRRA